MPVVTRASSLWRTSFRAVILGASALPAQPERRAAAGAPAEVSRTISLREFQAPQSAHWPCHLLWSAPHSVQT